MSDIITIAVQTVTSHSGGEKQYQVNLDTSIIDLIKLIVNSHPDFSDPKYFNIKSVDWLGCRLMYNRKTLEHFKTLEDHTEFQYKSNGIYKLTLLTKGGLVNTYDTPIYSDSEDSMSNQSHISSPISNQLHISSPISIRSDSPISRTFGTGPRSFPGTTSFLETQINRLDKRTKSEQIKQVSDAIIDLSNYLKTTQNQHYDQLNNICNILTAIDQKLGYLIDQNN